MIRCHPSSVMSSVGTRLVVPAQYNSTSMRPSSRRIVGCAAQRLAVEDIGRDAPRPPALRLDVGGDLFHERRAMAGTERRLALHEDPDHRWIHEGTPK